VEAGPQGGVGGVGEEAGAEGGDGALEARPEGFEGADALLSRFGRPLFEPAAALGVAFEAGGVDEEPEGDEVVERAFAEDGLEVELDISGTGEAAVVTQDPELAAVGHDGPQVVGAAVE